MSRPTVKPLHQARAVQLLEDALERREQKHGPGGYVSRHELLGILLEEQRELEEAIQSDDAERVADELLDVAAVAVFGIASSLAALHDIDSISETFDDLGGEIAGRIRQLEARRSIEAKS